VDGSVFTNLCLTGFVVLFEITKALFYVVYMVILTPLVFYTLRFLHFIVVLICVGRLVIDELFAIQIPCMWFSWCFS